MSYTKTAPSGLLYDARMCTMLRQVLHLLVRQLLR